MSAKCPYCAGKLISGTAKIHGTLSGFLFIGLSYENLYFESDDGEETEVLGSGCSTYAMMCEDCGTVTLNVDYSKAQEVRDAEIMSKKDSLVDILTIFSSKELCDNIQKSNPEIDVRSEIVKKWKENYLPNDEELQSDFTKNELTLLEKFNQLVNNNDWQKMEITAEKILDELNNG